MPEPIKVYNTQTTESLIQEISFKKNVIENKRRPI
jgi:hypothetical protein